MTRSRAASVTPNCRRTSSSSSRTVGCAIVLSRRWSPSHSRVSDASVVACIHQRASPSMAVTEPSCLAGPIGQGAVVDACTTDWNPLTGSSMEVPVDGELVVGGVPAAGGRHPPVAGGGREDRGKPAAFGEDLPRRRGARRAKRSRWQHVVGVDPGREQRARRRPPPPPCGTTAPGSSGAPRRARLRRGGGTAGIRTSSSSRSRNFGGVSGSIASAHRKFRSVCPSREGSVSVSKSSCR